MIILLFLNFKAKKLLNIWSAVKLNFPLEGFFVADASVGRTDADTDADDNLPEDATLRRGGVALRRHAVDNWKVGEILG